MASRTLKIVSFTFEEGGDGSRAMIAFNRNLSAFEQDGLESRIQRLVAESNRKK